MLRKLSYLVFSGSKQPA